MHTLTETWLLSRSTRGMRTRRRGSMRKKVIEIEQGTFTPLVFKTTGGMADECVKYHSRLEELIANKKGESYSSAISWIRAKVSFAIVRSAILCLRGSRSRRRQLDFVDSEFKTLDCLKELLTASEQQGMYLRNRYWHSDCYFYDL